MNKAAVILDEKQHQYSFIDLEPGQIVIHDELAYMALNDVWVCLNTGKRIPNVLIGGILLKRNHKLILEVQ